MHTFIVHGLRLCCLNCWQLHIFHNCQTVSISINYFLEKGLSKSGTHTILVNLGPLFWATQLQWRLSSPLLPIFRRVIPPYTSRDACCRHHISSGIHHLQIPLRINSRQYILLGKTNFLTNSFYIWKAFAFVPTVVSPIKIKDLLLKTKNHLSSFVTVFKKTTFLVNYSMYRTIRWCHLKWAKANKKQFRAPNFVSGMKNMPRKKLKSVPIFKNLSHRTHHIQNRTADKFYRGDCRSASNQRRVTLHTLYA